MINKIKSFINEIKEELKKISYPDKKALKSATYSIIFIVFFVAIYMEIIDLIFKAILKYVFNIY
ncbi:MAG: preprotein translocase subunit SecE [bacterium]|nr:preprotein translocase subunit SecE [bacterium]